MKMTKILSRTIAARNENKVFLTLVSEVNIKLMKLMSEGFIMSIELKNASEIDLECFFVEGPFKITACYHDKPIQNQYRSHNDYMSVEKDFEYLKYSYFREYQVFVVLLLREILNSRIVGSSFDKKSIVESTRRVLTSFPGEEYKKFENFELVLVK